MEFIVLLGIQFALLCAIIVLADALLDARASRRKGYPPISEAADTFRGYRG